MKVKQDKQKKTIVIPYSRMSGYGNGFLTISEWENGEGFNIGLGDTELEVTNGELHAICTAFLMFQNREWTGQWD